MNPPSVHRHVLYAFYRVRRLKRTGRIVDFGGDEDKARRINQGLPGYSLVDYAFNSAAGMYEPLPGEHDSQVTGFHSWAPWAWSRSLRESPGGRDYLKRRRRSSPMPKYFGAAGVGFTGLDKRWIYTHARFGREIVFEDMGEGYFID